MVFSLMLWDFRSFSPSHAVMISLVLPLSIILCSLFMQTSGLTSATAYGETTWINNIQPLDSWAPPLGDRVTMRKILLSNIVSYNGMNLQFGCGFFCYGIPCDKGYLFATFFIMYTTDGSLYDLQMVWSANREQLVQDNATLALTSTGNLMLKDADGSLVWSTNTDTQAFQGMRIQESGNLVLLNSSNGTLWQSFDHPTDTLLLGQKMKVGQKSFANISPINTSKGYFYASVLADGYGLFTGSTAPKMYYRYPTKPTYVNITYIQMDNDYANFFAERGGGQSDAIAFRLAIPKNSVFTKLNSDGHLMSYSMRSNPGTGISMIDYFSVYTNALTLCDYPRQCGGYGVCTDGQCSCPKTGEAFDQIDVYQPNFGCLPHNPLLCSETSINSRNPQGQQFLELEHVSYFTYCCENPSIPGLVSRDYCKNICFQNCSCKAAFFRYADNISKGYCYLESNVYSLKTNKPGDKFYNSTAYIKVQSRPKHSNFLVKVISVTIVCGVAVLFFSVWAGLTKFRKGRKEDEEDPVELPAGLPLRYSFQELQHATNDFSIKLGSGGFGSVYEGILTDSTKIAVKQLDRAGQGTKEFRAEVETLGNIHHLNLVRLKGFCAEKSHRILVYEYLSNGSLDKWIFPSKPHQHVLDWKTRSNIVLHIARGLAYLHEECRECIIHFDIKPENILLDENFNAKVSDFGLAKLINRDESEVITMLRGTPGYMAPELLNLQVTEKSDVFSFGIMVVEIVSGKRSREISAYGLLPALQLEAEKGRLTDLIDSGIKNEGLGVMFDAVKMLGVGMRCIQEDFTRRPAMSMVVKALDRGVDLLDDIPYAFTGSTSPPLLSSQETNNMGSSSYVPKSSVLSEAR
ncbi:hypothetical protein KI387_040263 [Taxus chinensis]|uniref:Receptor-like serine/threonine-protein kinase n=1 Tax=Taxus chinensis TaxID=29808 RepID=A0AA38F9P8_TAXCH|nr:hypothetical protein KI387_040263 [Taxus chinensis]